MVGWPRLGVLLCGVAFTLSCARDPALRPRPLPRLAAERRESIDALAARLFDGLRAGRPEELLVATGELAGMIGPEAQLRVSQQRGRPLSSFSAESFRAAWGPARYAGFCAQGAREEAAKRGLGLRSPGWVLERLLVVAEGGLARSASWVEGEFVYTEQGWQVLNLRRIEPPRFGHADLDLAPCDVEAGIR